MNKEFIPYKEALALKELGFNESTLGYFEDGDLDFEYATFNELDDNECLAPLYQQAFRWFREKHGISFFIQDIYPAGCQLNIHNGSDYDQTEYNTYEEAELACLKKLIEIVKGRLC